MYKIININFETEIEFQQQMAEHADTIHNNTLYGIDEAFNTDDDVTFVAFLNHDSMMAIPKDLWLENLENTLQYFISTEEYEKCSEVKQLVDKIS
jgi:hypothetical protein